MKTLTYYLSEDLWVENGKIIDPEVLFFDEKRRRDTKIDCNGALISAGLIDLQINGGFGVDFSYDIKDADTAARGELLSFMFNKFRARESCQKICRKDIIRRGKIAQESALDTFHLSAALRSMHMRIDDSRGASFIAS